MKLLGLISVILFSVLIAQHAVDGRKHGHHKRGKERVRSEAVEKIAAKVTPHKVQKATVADVGPVAQADNKTTAEKKDEGVLIADEKEKPDEHPVHKHRRGHNKGHGGLHGRKDADGKRNQHAHHNKHGRFHKRHHGNGGRHHDDAKINEENSSREMLKLNSSLANKKRLQRFIKAFMKRVQHHPKKQNRKQHDRDEKKP